MEDDKKLIDGVDVNGGRAGPGKLFVGGLASVTTSAQFFKHFGMYGEITDSAITKGCMMGEPKPFGFVTYADASVVDKVIEDTHIINGKQVVVKRTMPRGAGSSKEISKTKNIYVGGIPTAVTDQEFKDFFTKSREIKECQIIQDHATGRSHGFGFVTFEMEQAVDDLLSNVNLINFNDHEGRPKILNSPPSPPSSLLA